jgi:hypothetical protein
VQRHLRRGQALAGCAPSHATRPRAQGKLFLGGLDAEVTAAEIAEYCGTW